MTGRDKLIWLLQEYSDNNNGGGSNHGLADHLIANGVICPPCKVGDKVYFDTYLHGDSVGVQSHKVINVKYVITTEPSKGGIGAEIPDYAFGDTVFLTKEEAEAKLRERKEDEGK